VRIPLPSRSLCNAGNRFYFVSSGTLDAYSSGVTANDGLVNSFEAGSSFGELALMYHCPRTATVVARTACVLWSLDRTTFRRLLLAENLRKANLYEKFLEQVSTRAACTRRAQRAGAQLRSGAPEWRCAGLAAGWQCARPCGPGALAVAHGSGPRSARRAPRLASAPVISRA
jgi:hypothetical protein